MICITLNKQIQCDYICSKIQQLLAQYQNSHNISEAVLIINIVQTKDGGDAHIPKLQYDPSCNT